LHRTKCGCTFPAPRRSALNTFAHLGFVARGIAYIVIGVMALMVALRVARHEPDTAGAIEAIAAKPFGYLLLWILVIGFVGLAGWRLVQAAVRLLRPGSVACPGGWQVGWCREWYAWPLTYPRQGLRAAAGPGSAG
jgi:Domain of Unknown Function (DUF1206)